MSNEREAKAQLLQMIGCSTLIIAAALAAGILIIAWNY